MLSKLLLIQHCQTGPKQHFQTRKNFMPPADVMKAWLASEAKEATRINFFQRTIMLFASQFLESMGEFHETVILVSCQAPPFHVFVFVPLIVCRFLFLVYCMDYTLSNKLRMPTARHRSMGADGIQKEACCGRPRDKQPTAKRAHFVTQAISLLRTVRGIYDCWCGYFRQWGWRQIAVFPLKGISQQPARPPPSPCASNSFSLWGALYGKAVKMRRR